MVDARIAESELLKTPEAVISPVILTFILFTKFSLATLYQLVPSKNSSFII
jgi:hypothetical protein